MLSRDLRDIIGGLFFIALGGYVAWSGYGLGLGSAMRMGAGYVPVLLGVASVVLGALIFASGVASRAPRIEIVWLPLFAVAAGLFAFYLLISRAGLIPATMALTLISGIATRDLTTMQRLLLALGISASAYLLFAVGLGLPFRGIRGLF